jgi:monoamine oxidase
MAATATWCGDWFKVAALFKTPFWRAKGASGVAQTTGPVSSWWEGGNDDDGTYALVGLGVGQSVAHLAAEAEQDSQRMRKLVLQALGPVFGAKAVDEQLVAVRHHSWQHDPDTFAGAAAAQRDYGHPVLAAPLPYGVHFAATETERENGHVEGAVMAGQRAAEEVLAAFASDF